MSDNDENHLIAERRAKLARLRERGIAFPNDFRRNALAADLLPAYGEKSAEALDAAAIRVSVAGRMRRKAVMGKASFAKSGGFERRNPDIPAEQRTRRCLTMNSKAGMSAM